MREDFLALVETPCCGEYFFFYFATHEAVKTVTPDLLL